MVRGVMYLGDELHFAWQFLAVREGLVWRVERQFFILFIFFLFEFLEGAHRLFPEYGLLKDGFLGSEAETGVLKDVLLFEVVTTAHNRNDNMIDH